MTKEFLQKVLVHNTVETKKYVYRLFHTAHSYLIRRISVEKFYNLEVSSNINNWEIVKETELKNGKEV